MKTEKKWTKVGIVAGGGDLPLRLVQACKEAGQDWHLIRLEGYADEALAGFPGDDCGIAAIGKIIRQLKQSECDAVAMAGIVRRPDFSTLRPDWRGVSLLPKVVKAARQGDGALLNVLVGMFEEEGFTVLGAEEVAAPLKAPTGPLGAHHPTSLDFADMHKAAELVAAIGPFDVGQGAVVRNGFVLAVEAAEGTDSMLIRCANLPQEVRGFEPGEVQRARGVLLKRPKPGQERRVDLPTIGVETVKGAAAAGLAGIAVEGDGALVIDRAAVVEAADDAGIFIYGATIAELAAP
ncbi:MAG: UDP-2,3-diacylglucosamine diphosphatase LpxI [Pseudomonadota bacterium]